MAGKLIVIDGIDGSGKTTQTNMLYDRLKIESNFKLISFPNYKSASSSLVKMYLNGDISENIDDINCYACSSFYAADRYISYKTNWGRYYNQGFNIISSRYVSSNLIHQMSKLDRCDWNAFISWTNDFEYNKLLLPKPDKVIYLDMSISVSNNLIDVRGNEKDIHEKNIDYLNRCYEAFLYISEIEGWTVIKCDDGVRPFSVNQINDEIFKLVKEVI